MFAHRSLIALPRSAIDGPLTGWYSVAIWLPGALSAVMLSKSRSCASGGRYISKPSALQEVGCVTSNPLLHNAAGQSSRRSILTVRRSAAGTPPRVDIVVVLNSTTLG